MLQAVFNRFLTIPYRTMGTCVALLVLVTACDVSFSSGSRAKFRDTRTNQVAHVADQALHVESGNGSIKVWRQDREDVEIIASLKAYTDERLKAAQVVAQRGDDGTLKVSVNWPGEGRKSSEGCSFEIRIPNARGITLNSSNGKLVVEGFSGTANLESSNGSVEITDHAGPVQVKTRNGKVTARGIKGPVQARSSNGTIKIQLADGVPGPVTAETSNGSIELELSKAFVGELDLKTSNGRIRTEGVSRARVISSKKNHTLLQVGDSEQKSKAKTSNGSITVTTQ